MLLDTNVLSELMRPRPAAAVLDWFATPSRQPSHAISAISAITQAEILLGIALLPDGQRKAALSQAAAAMFEHDFKDHILAFDTGTSAVYARIVAHRSAQGRPITTEDAQIAATALQHRMVLVTRNTRDFDLIPDLQLINPWDT
jgi:predicted nucleic acid-binding protein